METNTELKNTFLRELDAFDKEPLCFVSRDEWGAQPAREKELQSLIHPIQLVHITKNSQTLFCKTKESCVNRVKEMQVHQMGKGSPDIFYNFLVGEDECVYEGRGWNFKPFVDSSEKITQDMVLHVAFIGDWRLRRPKPEMFSAILLLLRDGIKKKLLHKYYSYTNFSPISQS